MSPEQRLACKLLNHRGLGEYRLHSGGSGDVPSGQHPSWGALKPLDELGLLDQFGDDLDRAGAGADDRDPLAGEVIAVVPPGTVDLVTAVGIDAADVGEAGVGQRPGRQYDGAGPKALAGGRGCGPHAGMLVERQPGDLLAEPNVAADVEAGGHLFDVAADFLGRRVSPRPGRVLDERKRVQQRRDVTAGARIAGVSPGSAYPFAALQDDDVLDAGLRQFDRGAP